MIRSLIWPQLTGNTFHSSAEKGGQSSARGGRRPSIKQTSEHVTRAIFPELSTFSVVFLSFSIGSHSRRIRSYEKHHVDPERTSGGQNAFSEDDFIAVNNGTVQVSFDSTHCSLDCVCRSGHVGDVY